MKLKNITLAEYIALTEEEKENYEFALLYATECEARDVLEYGDMTKKPFGDVKDYQYLFNKENSVKSFIDKYGYEYLNLLSVFDFFAFYRYIYSEVERINNIENILLSYEPTNEEIEAGMDGMAKFSAIIQIDALAGGDVLKYESIRKLTYEDGLTKLALDKERNEYQKRYMKIITRKKN